MSSRFMAPPIESRSSTATMRCMIFKFVFFRASGASLLGIWSAMMKPCPYERISANMFVKNSTALPAGKAVEFFTNMLAEIRSYGQGFIIADQIPNKLAPEALKNTNLKIMHRIVATDDRDSMGGAMNLDDIQKRHVTALGQGRAIVYAEKMEQPFHLAIMYDKSREVPPPETPEESDQIVRDA